MGEWRIRAGERADLPGIDGIYDPYIRDTGITFDLEPFGRERREAWFAQFGGAGRHRLLVAAEEDALLGYACSHAFRPKGAYATSVETSVYVRRDQARRGVGSALYAALFRALEGEDVHRAYAGITLPNPASVALHRRFGFREIGIFREVGRKLGRYWDVAWWEKAL